MPAKTYTVTKVTAIKEPPGKVVRLDNPGPPPEFLLISDPTADEWVLFCSSVGASVTVTSDATGNRTMVSKP